MYFSLGETIAIMQEDVIGIFDLDATTIKKRTRDYLNIQQKKNNISNACSDLPLSFIVCKNKVYFSSIRSQTLCARWKE